MKHWKTTLCGAAQGIGWILAGIGIYADLAGLPKSYPLAHTALAGFIIIGISAMLHGWHAADK